MIIFGRAQGFGDLKAKRLAEAFSQPFLVQEAAPARSLSPTPVPRATGALPTASPPAVQRGQSPAGAASSVKSGAGVAAPAAGPVATHRGAGVGGGGGGTDGGAGDEARLTMAAVELQRHQLLSAPALLAWNPAGPHPARSTTLCALRCPPPLCSAVGTHLSRSAAVAAARITPLGAVGALELASCVEGFRSRRGYNALVA